MYSAALTEKCTMDVLKNEQDVTLHEQRGGDFVTLVKEKQWFQLPRLSMKELHKDQKGLTLIELLAVIVILAIIAAIAIPSIGGILKNTRASAHKSNGHMVIDAARLYISGEGITIPSTGQTFTLEDLNKKGYLENIPQDPSNKGSTYDPTGSFVNVTREKDASGNETGNYVYAVTLKGTGAGATTYISGVAEKDLDSTTVTMP